MGICAVIRDSKGIVIVAGIQQTTLKGEVSFAKAEAMRWGLQIAKEAALSNLIVETDCQEVVELVNNTKGSKTEIFWIVSDIQDQRKYFQKTTVQYVPRYCNAYAHSLAKFGLGRKTSAI